MKKLILVILLLSSLVCLIGHPFLIEASENVINSTTAKGRETQRTVTYYINPAGGENTYTSFTEAINALNISGVEAGGVIFNVAAGTTYTENCPPITATGTSSSPIIFQKSGEGANPIIYAGVGTGTTDAIITLIGCDYVTFDGIDLSESTVNITDIQQAEYGLWVKNTSVTDGAQHNTIKNANISMNRANINS